jgi:hypothetical protein
MSTIFVNTLTGTSTAGSIAVTGEGNSTTTNLQQGLAKAWVHFDGSGTVGIDDSFNIGSLTDNGTGNYTTAFSNNMNSANYAIPTACNLNGTQADIAGSTARTSSQTTIDCLHDSGSGDDMDDVFGTWHGDLT